MGSKMDELTELFTLAVKADQPLILFR